MISVVGGGYSRRKARPLAVVVAAEEEERRAAADDDCTGCEGTDLRGEGKTPAASGKGSMRV